MDALDRIRNKRLSSGVVQQSQPEQGLEDRLAASRNLNSQRGVLPWVNNALSNVNEGLTQVIETPYNIVNNAPRLVNLLPGEQGMQKNSEMAKNATGTVGKVARALFPSEDPLIDLVKKHHGGIQDDNPNYPKSSQFFEDVGLGVGGLGMNALAAKFGTGILAKFAQYLNAPVAAAPGKAIAGEVLASGGAASGREVADATNMGPVASTFAEIIGAMSPGMMMYSGPKTASAVFGREGADESLAAMERQGIRPSVGLTGNRTAASMESGASALPLFGSVPENVRNKQFDQFSDALTGAAERMRPAGATARLGTEMAEQTQDIVQEGAKRMQSGFSAREEALMKAIGPQTPVDTTNLRAAIADQMQRGDAKIKRALQSELDDLDSIADATTGAVPYENLRKWRSNFGSSLEDQGVLTGAKKQIYAGVTQDTEAVAKAAGQGDEFTNLMKDQAKAHSDELSLADGGDLNQADITLKGGQSEKSGRLLRQAYTNPDRMDYLRRNATPEQWDQLRGDIAHDLGLAKAGGQDATGEVVSPKKFITEWNKMDPRVKNMLFDDNLGTKQTLDDLALIAADFERRGLEANTSRTAGTGLAAMQIKNFAGGVAGGAAANQLSVLPEALAAAGITYASIKGLMSETLARWAAGRTPTLQGTVAARAPGAVARGATDEENPE